MRANWLLVHSTHFDRKVLRCGFADSFGLLNMQERATLIDADYSLDSGPDGTTVQVILPLDG